MRGTRNPAKPKVELSSEVTRRAPATASRAGCARDRGGRETRQTWAPRGQWENGVGRTDRRGRPRPRPPALAGSRMPCRDPRARPRPRSSDVPQPRL
eukprot:3310986-Prymnesium_polylepis.1